MKQGRILVVRGGAIGDFLLTLPALAALRAQFPDVHLEVLGYPHISRLAVAAGLADETRAIEARPLAGFFARNGELQPELAAYFASFSVILSYLYDPDEIFKTNVGLCSKAQFISGPHRPDEARPLHATETFLKPLERLAIFGADPIPKLAIPPCPAGADVTRRWLAVHPGSGSGRKNWPEEQWGGLLAQLTRETDLNFLLIGGEAEGQRLDHLATQLPGGRFLLARGLSLVDLAARMLHCVAFVGHDSGITHLAAAAGLPVLSLWGETNATVWRPLGEKVTIIREPGGLKGITVARVREELADLLATHDGPQQA